MSELPADQAQYSLISWRMGVTEPLRKYVKPVIQLG